MDLWALADLCTPWCVHVVATLNIAAHIQAGHADIGTLAAAAGTHPESLHRVLRHLVSHGVFEESAPGRFTLNDAARPLLDPAARVGLDLDSFGGRMALSWGTLLSAVRTGNPAYHELFGRAFWPDLEAHPDISAAFDSLMGPAGHGAPDPHVLVNPADWASIHHVVDVGGGTGSLLAEVLLAHPTVLGTLVDLPRTVGRAADTFLTAGVADRVTTVARSFFDPLPAGADLYLLKNVLGDWPDPQAAAILHQCAEAARPNNGRVVTITNAGPGEPASPSLLMLVLLGSKDRTLDELIELALASGLTISAVGRQPSGRLIVEFRPV